MDGLKQKIFIAAFAAMLNSDPWNEEFPLDEKLKKAWKTANEGCEFVGKKVRNERNKPRGTSND